MLYEINYLVLQSKTSELEKIREEMKKFIESFDAKITAEREYLKRKLSYEISHERYGFFTVLRFEIKDNAQIQELKKSLNIKEDVSRYIIVRADELPSLEEQAQKETDVQRKDTLKHEEVEKALAEEAKKTPEKKPEVKPEKAEEEKEEKKEETSKAKEAEIDEKETTEEKESTDKQDDDAKKESGKEKGGKEKDDEEEEKDEKVSLDELDKKLDEILNL